MLEGGWEGGRKAGEEREGEREKEREREELSLSTIDLTVFQEEGITIIQSDIVKNKIKIEAWIQMSPGLSLTDYEPQTCKAPP